MNKDEHVRIVDYLPRGKSEVPPHKRKPIAQAVGENFFSLLEIVPRSNVSLETGEKVYIGEGTRDKVDHIERRIKYDWLTPNAKTELGFVLVEIIKDHEEKFIRFYNTAGTISTRLHKLEILPRIGTRHRPDILNEREVEPFKSFKDMHDRVKNIPDPVKVLADKIIQELKGESKYNLFVPLVKERRG
jgi:putative nucleotide binding protein